MRHVKIVNIISCLLIGAMTGCKEIREQFPELPTFERPAPLPPKPAQSPTAAKIETTIYQQINQVRQQDGLKGLKKNDRLAEVARRYSQQMAEKEFFSHTGADGTNVADRVEAGQISFQIVGENLYMGTNIRQPADNAVEGWMNSPGHRENLLRPVYAETGIGVWKKGNTYYITQLFLRQ
ncbi:CAP domain-containing protein [Leptolyngbya sp. NIES-2104]|uniref:CAP domain-containing protein n=1 Tax=Leptolyngbya sp. NIES-2104 TaxID=1552121 RepID=UPI0006EC7EAC|nr:CAP domain-containing protein [Leptolyngbya sp. NIES-2104]GAP97898.1 transporter [Leptolyngbya sp. NIES-2104]